ncbi:DUF4037 domain-containing protein [Butyrivibrio sp. CB08]|uniref:DUF4037 domain-containing protein n=1 Tax=Butyrivibrio sp. CB08 TaxID=2364879 RepID=UPI000EA87835|nr:DUF4037 domain-containing protein [Butyrivibrio sp. CB08]RKM59441.1 DUF4037 domain-containing protein [Butyrivibrio sp. CB08]
MNEIIEKSRRFYENQVAPMIRSKFPEYESRIAVGIAGEGSDCFGYDDFISRDHDFGTGVCLWLTDEDFSRFGRLLSIAYNELVATTPGADLTDRLSQRRGVMTISGFYSYVLGTDCDAEKEPIPESTWRSFDYSCLATAVNGEVFRDDLGIFSAYRKSLLSYYPDRIWRERIATELHNFSASLQVNYSRCMARKDTVAAEICKARGLEAAMELFFLLKRVYPPYYKWTFRALSENWGDSSFARHIKDLAETGCCLPAWEHIKYMPDNLNMSDKVVVLSEQIAEMLRDMLNAQGLSDSGESYLEKHVDVILGEIV